MCRGLLCALGLGCVEATALEFRAEFFNFLNNTSFAGVPGRIVFTPNFGRYFRPKILVKYSLV